MRPCLISSLLTLALLGTCCGQTTFVNNVSGSVTIGGAGPITLPDNLWCPLGAPTWGSTDGPATLPLACFNTALINTPAPGAVVNVSTAGELTTALAAAVCGQQITLQAGTTFSGNFVIPPLSCASNNYLWIVSSGLASLPPEGSRVTPCYFGVSAVSGRPYSCSSTTKFGATILASGIKNRPLVISGGTHYVRFIGIEFGPDPANAVTNLVSPLVQISGGNTDHIIFDRVFGHGNAADETQRFTILTGTTNIAFIDGWYQDFHCVAIIGACTDASVINMGLNTTTTEGVYKIVNNYMEASGENLGFGGGAATGTPADVEIRLNTFWKPQFWNPASGTYNGGVSGHPFIAKNLFETKNSNRVLIEGNTFTNSWAGFTQVGEAILFDPKNQSNACPLCEVTNMVFRYNTGTNVAQVYQLANAPSDAGGLALAGNSYSIHDNVWDDIADPVTCGLSCSAVTLRIGMVSDKSLTAGSSFLAHDLFQNHETYVVSAAATRPPSNGLGIDGPTIGPLQFNLTLQNLIMPAGTNGVGGIFGGGVGCAFGQGNVNITQWLNACWIPGTWTLTNNAIVGGTHSGWNWPANGGVTFPATYSAIGFVNYSGGNGGDYRLCTGVNLPAAPCAGASAYHNAATDGTDIGANIVLVNSVLAGNHP